jgi:hypothetical protein
MHIIYNFTLFLVILRKQAVSKYCLKNYVT